MASEITISFTEEDLLLFSEASGDRNPLHLSIEYARSSPYGQPLVFGCLAAIACSGHIPLPPGWTITRLQAEFLRPMVLGVHYRLQVLANEGGWVALLFDGSMAVLSVAVKARPSREVEAAAIPDGSHFDRCEAAVRELAHIPEGLEISGDYASDPASLAALVERWGAVDPFLATVLSWSSYLVGMELPGESNLCAMLVLHINGTARCPTRLTYRASVGSLHLRIGQIRIDAALSIGDHTIVSGQYWCFMRPALPGVSPLDLTTVRSDSLAGKVAVIIGASRGLGAAVKRAMELRGAIVYSLSRSSIHGKDTLAEMGDAADIEAVERLRDRVLKERGRLDFLICNGCPPILPLRLESNAAERISAYINQAVSISLVPLCAFLGLLDTSDGCAVIVSSSAVEHLVKEWPHYVAAKQAIEMLARVASLQYPRLRTLIVRPPKLLTSLTNTPMGSLDAAPPELFADRIAARLEQALEAGRTEILTDMDPAGPSSVSTGCSIVPERDRIESLEAGCSEGRTDPKLPQLLLAICASYTADPIREILEWWVQELRLNFEIRLAPTITVSQELLNPSGTFSTNVAGVNVLLVRLEDLGLVPRTQRTGEPDLITNVNELVAAVNSALSKTSTPLIVVVCPPDRLDEAAAEAVEKFRVDLLSGVDDRGSIDLVSWPQLFDLYGLTSHLDENSYRLAGIPYTDECFAAIASMVMRLIYARSSPPRKVIVLDCDHTLWRGICGEDDVAELFVDGPYRDLQSFMRTQHEAGKLLCLCSKNNEGNVWRVFDHWSEMPLRPEHFTCHRINWLPKSTNIKAIAAELGLALDSFIFVDDSPAECAEVEALCPGVIAIPLTDANQAPAILKHSWVFDTVSTTPEDEARPLKYLQNRLRVQLEAEFSDYREFIRGLKIRLTLSELREEHFERVAQLTQRTNQFNASARRRTVGEIRNWYSSGEYRGLVAQLEDRFGSYGLIGAIVYRKTEAVFIVETMVLSCRAFGRNVEHALLCAFSALVHSEGGLQISVEYRETLKNRMVSDFLSVCGGQRSVRADGISDYIFSSEDIERLADASEADIEVLYPVRVEGERRFAKDKIEVEEQRG